MSTMARRKLPALIVALVLLLLPLLLFAPVALGNRTLLPVDALFSFEPYRAARGEFGVDVAQNGLLVDLILENYAWKSFLLEAIRNQELPLWDPYIFAGHPFLANGQHSALYPLSLVFYILPLWRAYGVFTWLQLGLAGWWAALFARTLGIRRLGALVTGIAFQLSGFMLASVVHPMIVAGASWLPFLLAMVERVIIQRPALGRHPATLPWALLGGLGLGCQLLVGHAENTYFVLLVAALYAGWRLLTRPGTGAEQIARTSLPQRGAHWLASARRPVLFLLLMVVLGLALGAVQFIPLYEVVDSSFRSGQAAASLAQVRGWAYPPRRLITFAVPNFFGNPAHHSHFDLFHWRTVQAITNAYGEPISSHDWGIKNYVEGGAYLGLLPMFLAFLAILAAPAADSSARKPGPLQRVRDWWRQPHIPFFTLLSLFSLGCIFGTPLYALVYALPYLSQSHSPFRWVFPLTLSVAVLAGFGVDILRRSREVGGKQSGDEGWESGRRSLLVRLFLLDAAPSPATALAGLAFWGGAVALVGLLLSRVFFARIEPLVERIFWNLALAPNGFSDHRAFYSYEFKWIGLFALLLMASGIVLRVSRCPIFVRRRPVWEFLALGVLTLDLVSFGAGFNPAVDPALLDYTPPVVEFLQQDTSPWRYATFTPPGTTKTMNANTGMFYDLQTVAGYDSLFSRQYADYMGLIEEQDELQYNRIASFSEWSSLDSPLTDLLNVKYVLSEVEIPNPAKYRLVYEDEAVRVYENLTVLPRAFSLPASAVVVSEDPAAALRQYDPHAFLILEAGSGATQAGEPQPGTPEPQTVSRYGLNEVWIDASMDEAGWLVLADTCFSGWRAFVRPKGAGEEAEREVAIHRADGNFRAVSLSPGTWTVRFKYSPNSVKIGAFVTFIAGMLVLFLTGLYLWRFFYREQDDASTVRRVAKNSIAPIVLNLFNRAIDFAFAALMARILGPVGTGRYATAINVYLLFDIVANFGLDMFLMREVARDRARARRLFVNSTVLRLLLFVLVTPLLGGFLAGWQSLGTPLTADTMWAAALLYLGLLPGSVAYGLAALFRGCERHEVPAAIQTVTTIAKVTLGVLALVGGMGIVGLAGAAVLTNTLTLVVLALLARQLLWGQLPQTEDGVRWSLQRSMLRESWPLMVALLLQALFPGVNVLLLQNLQGDAAVGWYDAGRKWVDALNIVPQFFTLAVFPIMSHQAVQDPFQLRKSYCLSIKLLTMLTLPVAIVTTVLASTLVGLLSGQKFLPHGAIALQLLIWSIVFGWINSLTNYVLIALDRQRYVLVASGARVLFTIAANLVFVRTMSYVASAWIIIVGELFLAVLFHLDLRRHLGALQWLRTLGRPLLAGAAMGGVAWLLVPASRLLACASGLLVYLVALLLLRAFTREEWAMLLPLIPARLRKRIPAPKPST